MAVAYLNGGGPTYPGVSFANQTEYCTLVRDLLLSVGWTVVSGTPSSLPIVFRSAIAVNGVYVYLHFDYALDVAHTIRVRGSTDGVSANLSPEPNNTDTYHSRRHSSIFFDQNGNNRLWAVCDEDTLILYTRRSGDLFRTCTYYGRTDLTTTNPADGWAWGIFDLTPFQAQVTGGYQFPGYFVRRFNSPVFWQTIPGNGNFNNVEWLKYNALTLTSREYPARVASNTIGLGQFDAVNNYKIPIVPSWRVEENGFFRGLFKFVVNGLYGAPIDSIHTRYVPDSNKIVYYISYIHGSTGNSNHTYGFWTAGMGAFPIAES